MNTRNVRKQIETAIADERATGRLAALVRQVAEQNGAHPTQEQVEQTVGFVREYVEHVPLYLEQGAAAAREVGLGAEMERMTGEIELYWREVNDLIPDHLGLVGVMDDAYASLLLLQAVSDYCQQNHGRPLLQQDLTAANRLMQQLIGAPITSQLEARVGMTIAQAMMQKALQQLAARGFGFGFGYGGAPDPIWGNASVDEIVKARMGAMGIV